MSDEHVRVARLALVVLQQVEHLCLDRYVQRRHGFVCDDQVWVRRERARQRHPLLLTAAKLRRLAVQERRIETDGLHQLFCTLGALLFVHSGKLSQRPDYGVPDWQLRIERRRRVLENHAHRGALVLGAIMHVTFEVLAVQFERTSVFRLKSNNSPGGRALS